ncbi:MAG: hypothetical protein SFW36_04165 [Leptolyngbyaceae cyanobacterium bins.59]|nr:hypothetical protein [Leptolyngbyaceae cyanobacterium bins.59]
MATQAISAFWLPFALQSRGASPEVVQQAANECRLLLQRQQYWLNQAFGESLVAATPIVAPEPIAPPRILDYRTDEEENDYDASDFSGAIDGNYLLDDE